MTASVTLRDAPVKSKKAGHNAETSSIYSAADTVRTDGTEEADGVLDEDEDEDLAGMEEIDLLGGLGASRPETVWAVADGRRRADADISTGFEHTA